MSANTYDELDPYMRCSWCNDRIHYDEINKHWCKSKRKHLPHEAPTCPGRYRARIDRDRQVRFQDYRRENGIPIVVFNILKKGNLRNVLEGKRLGTIVA